MTQVPAQSRPLEYRAPALPARAASGAGLWTKLLWPAVGLALLLLFDYFAVPHFFRMGTSGGHLVGTPINIFRQCGPEVLVALGMTLVLATGGVDLSVGAIMALAGAVIAQLQTSWGLAPWQAMLAGLGVSVLAGAWNGALVTLLEIQPIVATLVLMVGGRGLAEQIAGESHVWVQGRLFDVLGQSPFGVPTAGLVGLAVLVLTAAFTRLTSAGLMIEATGGNPMASRYAGVAVNRVTLLVYVFSGLCAGLAGLLQTADDKGADASHLGLFWELDAILAAVIGGTALTGGRFSLAGAVLGSVLIVTLTETVRSKAPVEYALVPKAIVVLAVCLLQSEAVRRRVFGPLRRLRLRAGSRSGR